MRGDPSLCVAEQRLGGETACELSRRADKGVHDIGFPGKLLEHIFPVPQLLSYAMRVSSMMMRAFFLISFLTIASTVHAAPELAEQEAAKAYDKARSCYNNLMLDEPKQKLRGNWEKCMSQFAAIARDYDETAKAPDALFTLAKMYRLLGQQSHSKEDAKESYAKFDDFTDRYKKSRYYDDALYEMACIKLYTFGDDSKAKRLLTQIIRWDPDGDRVNDAKNLLAKIKSGKVKVGEPEPMKPQGALLQPKTKPLEATTVVAPPPVTPVPAKTATPTPAEKKSPQP